MQSQEQPASDAAYVIFGATGGIGSALSRRLAAAGANLLLAARDREKLEALASETGTPFFAADVTNGDEVQACFDDAVSRFGSVSGAANCVGSVFLKPAHITSDEEWTEVLEKNLGSSFRIVRSGARAMMKNGGSIVLFSTAAARIGIANHEAIAAAKGGVTGLALSAAATYAARGSGVNVMAPGLVETPAPARITGNVARRKASLAMHPLGRLGRPEDVAAMAEWLLQPANDWLTGQTFGIDGGLGRVRSR